MPKPFVIRRPSGLYARFLVPADLRQALGSRFLVRPIYQRHPDRARLVAAVMAASLSSLFERVRKGGRVDKDELDRIFKKSQEWTAARLTLPSGIVLEGVDVPPGEEEAFRNSLGMVPLPNLYPSGVPTVSRPQTPEANQTLAQAIAEYRAVFDSSGRAEGNKLDTRFTLELFRDMTDPDLLMGDMNTAHVDAFLAHMISWPPNASKKRVFRDLKPLEIVAKSQSLGAVCISRHTRIKHGDRLSAFLNWALRRNAISANFMHGRPPIVPDDDEDTRRFFSDAELAAIFDPVRYAQHCSDVPHKFWGPLLGLFTGARVREIAQLYVDDIEQVNDVWGIHIAPRRKDQKVKNKASKRFVPVHPELERIGFLKFVGEARKAGQSRLFPQLGNAAVGGYGDGLSDWFMRTYLRTKAGVTDPEVNFHSFRRLVSTRLDRQLVSEPRVAEITGHDRGGSVLRKHYIQVMQLPERYEDIKRLAYPGLTLPVYKPGMFAAALAALPQPTTPTRKAKGRPKKV